MRIALGLIGAACLAVANGFSVAQREKFLESAVRIRSRAIQHAEAVAGRALQGVTDQELKDASSTPTTNTLLLVWVHTAWIST